VDLTDQARNTFAPVPYVSGFQAGLTASKRIDPTGLPRGSEMTRWPIGEMLRFSNAIGVDYRGCRGSVIR
jgi:hypothetical protein